MKILSQIRKAGFFAWATPAFLLVILLLTSSLLVAQQKTRPRVLDSILGVGIGTHFEQAHAKLDHLRKGETPMPRNERTKSAKLVTKRCGL
jgi:hypothetical protein